MNKLLPEEINVVVNGTQADVWLYVTPELFWFNGHFPTQPVLPGVAQLNWIIYYSQKIFNVQMNMVSIDVIKFQCPVLPSDKLHLHLDWNNDTNKLIFSYSIIDKVVSSGKLKL